MNYLFGDSTPSELTSNFLEFLRDALDFSVHAVVADERIHAGEDRSMALRADADVETERLEKLVTAALAGVDAADKDAAGAADSPATTCAQTIREAIGNAHRASLESLRQRLAAAVAQIEADEAATRAACLEALGAMLRPHDPPDAAAVVDLSLGSTGAYDAKRTAHADFGLDWAFRLSIPSGHPFSAPLRVERTMPQLEIRAPQLAGWISKEVKVKPTRVERYLVSGLTAGTTSTSLSLRAELGADAGFDFEITGDAVTATKVGPSEDKSTGSFDVDPADAPKLVELATKLRAAALELEQSDLLSASSGDMEFSALPGFVPFVESFVAMMTPIVREIAERSLTPNELVIRRPLANDRREEIFVPKATLREKYAALTPAQRAVFAPLGLDAPTMSSRPPAVKKKEDAPSVRAELPKSLPPPPARSAPAAERISSSDLKTVPLDVLAPAAAPPAPVLPPPTPPPMRPEADSAPVLEVTAVETTERYEALVGGLKKIALLSRNGRTEEAYREYATLFSSPAFAEYREADRRQALRLMVLAKSPPKMTDTVRAAYEAALPHIEALVKEHDDPADLELLGVARLAFDDEKGAGEAFGKALALERARNPQSELCGTLMKRVAAL